MICERMKFMFAAGLASRNMFSILTVASFVSSAWIVVIDPGWPVFMALSIVTISGPRHSPTMMRLGLERSAVRRSISIVISPTPSSLAGRASKLLMLWQGICGFISFVSSIVSS